MKREFVLEILKQNREQIIALGIRNLHLFGSVARGESHSQSDVDLLAELTPPLTYDRYIQAKFYLEDLLGCLVDLVLEGTLGLT